MLETEIDNFKIVDPEDSIIACAALYPIGEDFAEIACIAIESSFQKNGYGDRLLSSLESQAKTVGVKKIFVLTTVASHWFLGKGFLEAELSDLPETRQELYNYQRKSKVLLKIL